MNNKVLAVFSVVPMFLFGIAGGMNVEVDESVTAVGGILMFVFMSWAAYRLYNTPEVA